MDNKVGPTQYLLNLDISADLNRPRRGVVGFSNQEKRLENKVHKVEESCAQLDQCLCRHSAARRRMHACMHSTHNASPYPHPKMKDMTDPQLLPESTNNCRARQAAEEALMAATAVDQVG